MSRNNSYKIICSSILLLAALYTSAQPKTTVKVTVDKNKILIGEPIQLTLEADIPENEPIRFFYIDSIPHFEFLDKPPIDTTNTSEGTMLSQTIRITSFDSGHWVIPAFVLRGDISTDSIPIDVVFSEFNPEQDYHDIKDIIEVDPKPVSILKRFLYLIIGAAVLFVVLVVLLIYFLTRKKKVIPPAPPVDPYQEAMGLLEKLKTENLDHKQYYSRLVDIFRLYVLKRKGIHSLQKTTDDLVVQLKGLPVAREKFDKLSQALRLSDFVKFAKYIPSADDGRDAFVTIKETITEIEQIK